MSKKVIFRNKPYTYSSGIYNFPEEGFSAPYNIDDSTSVPIRYDKFSDKDLYTLSEDNQINSLILAGNLKYMQNNFIKINDITIENAGVNYDINKISFHVFLCDSNRFEDTWNTSPKDMSYSTLYSALFNGSNGLIRDSRIWSGYHGAKRRKGWGPGRVLKDEIVLAQLYNESSPGVSTAQYFDDFDSGADSNFKPAEAFRGFTDSSAGGFNTGIFDFFGQQEIYLIVVASGNADKNIGNDSRDRRIHIFTINSRNDLYDEEGNTHEGVFDIDFKYHDSVRKEGGGRRVAAFICSSLSVSINTIPNQNFNNMVMPPEQYNSITGSVEPPIRVGLGREFNSQILKVNPFRQVNSEVDYNYSPISYVNILNTNYDIQNYYTEKNNRQIASAPAQISLDFRIASPADFDSVEAQQVIPSLGHYFYVVSWSDNLYLFDSWVTFIGDFPETEVDLIEKQDSNLYNFTNIGQPLIHNYQSPGIKTIKVVMFSYKKNYITNTIEPVRWKLVKVRVFLDIPINQYPDFGEVGGSDYTTLPWPYTTVIVGGLNRNSKYNKSINDILSGGKIGNTDIIDETFLVDAKENDELGKNIETMDLEQIRFFNTNHNMNKLLGIEDKMIAPNDAGGVPIQDFFGISDSENSEASWQNLDFIKAANWMISTVIEQDETIDREDETIETAVWNPTTQTFENFNDDELLTSIEYANQYKIVITAINSELGASAILYHPLLYSPLVFQQDLEYYDDVIEYGETYYSETISYPTTNMLSPPINPPSGMFANEEFKLSVSGYSLTEASYVPSINPQGTADEWCRLSGYNSGAYEWVESDLDDAYPYTMWWCGEEGEFCQEGIEICSNLPPGDCPVGTTGWQSLITYPYSTPVISEIVCQGVYEDTVIPGGSNPIDTISHFNVKTYAEVDTSNYRPHKNMNYWDCRDWYSERNYCFSDETSVGQIFINDNIDSELVDSCKFEINTSNLIDKSIYDSSGNGNKGMVIGDYKIKKQDKDISMEKDSYIKIPKKGGGSGGAI